MCVLHKLKMYVLKIVIIKLRLNKGVTVMSEEKHVVEHEQQKKEKTKSNTSHFGLS